MSLPVVTDELRETSPDVLVKSPENPFAQVRGTLSECLLKLLHQQQVLFQHLLPRHGDTATRPEFWQGSWVSVGPKNKFLWSILIGNSSVTRSFKLGELPCGDTWLARLFYKSNKYAFCW